MDIPCFYDPENGRHNSVANVTNGKAVFSTAGELFVGKKLVQMIASEIEWTYPSSEKGNTSERGSLRKKVKSRHLDFEDKYMKSSNNLKRIMTMVIMESPVPARRKKIHLQVCDQQEEVDAGSARSRTRSPCSRQARS